MRSWVGRRHDWDDCDMIILYSRTTVSPKSIWRELKPRRRCVLKAMIGYKGVFLTGRLYNLTERILTF